MLTIKGKGVSGGVAIGHVRLVQNRRADIEQHTATEPLEEWRRYEAARQMAVRELGELCARAAREVGEQGAQIFETHAMMAEDEDFNETVRYMILTERSGAAYAVSEAGARHAALFSDMDDAYMRERASDVKDVAERIVRHLLGGTESAADKAGGDIVCAMDLTPSQTLALDRGAVKAFVTAHGSLNSHTAILSRTMGIPAVVGIGETAWSDIRDGMAVAVDADEGLVYLDPNESTLAALRARMTEQMQAQEQLDEYRSRESATPDGRRIELCVNAGSVEDVLEASRLGADGIGLFRSEFLYMGRDTLPGEDEQLAVYRRVLRAMPNKRVVVRTLDIGADKQASCLDLPREENPALGMRAIRISLLRPDVFLTQARALLRASTEGKLAVMFPMVISTDEVARLLALWKQAQNELLEHGVAFSPDVELGIMIETPAAAIISDRLAAMVDFFSIGSNDLTQYTLAIDRQNAALEPFCDTHHPALMHLIRHTVASAHRAGIWVGICGELGAELDLTEEFLRMGVDELSVTPPALLPLRRRVCCMGQDELKTTEKGEKSNEKQAKH